MKFNGQQYFRASIERMRQAREIHSARRGYALAMYVSGLGRLQGIKGDALKKNSSDLLNAAQTVVDRGVVLWTFKKK
mgnify:CR=1 FL=1